MDPTKMRHDHTHKKQAFAGTSCEHGDARKKKGFITETGQAAHIDSPVECAGFALA